METDHLDRGSRFSRSRPPILRNLALATAALLLVSGAQSAPPQSDHERTVRTVGTGARSASPQGDHGNAVGANPTANNTQPAGSDPVPCASLNSKKPTPYGVGEVPIPDDWRQTLHSKILSDVGDLDGARVVEKNWFYALTAVGIVLGTIAAFLIAVDFHLYKSDGERTPRPWRKYVLMSFQFGATMVIGALATFKLAEMWQTRVDGRYQLRNLDSELVVGGCTTDAFSRIYRQVNLIEAEEDDLRGIFSPATSQTTSTGQHGEDTGLKPPEQPQDEQTQEEHALDETSDNLW